MPRSLTCLALLALGAGLSLSCGPGPERAAWRIVPRDADNALGKRSTSESDLRSSYGASHVKPTRIELGEGESAEGTVLFPEDSLRRVEIVWQEPVGRRIPARVVLRGSRSVWKLPGDVTLGMTLAELERRNGRPFALSGFGWDYEGVVTSWSGGVLDTTLASDVKVYLKPDPGAQARAEYARVQGDRAFTSSLPEMRVLNPRVYQIFVDYEHRVNPGQSAHAPLSEIRESEQGMTVPVAQDERFTVILDQRTHPQQTLDVTPRGVLGRDSSVPDVDPPLYAARFLALKPGTCTITAKGFWVRIEVQEKPSAARP
jgi:hypothetical protein